MQTVKIEATSRPQSGKGLARRLRAEGKIPAVLYGKGKETRALTVSPKSLLAAFSGRLGQNVVLELDIDGNASETAQVVDYQVHPVSRALLHADFKVVTDDQPVAVRVPLRLVGKPKGSVMGGVLRQVYRDLPITCLPGQIPEALEHDVTELDVEDVVSVGELKLPEGVQVTLRANMTVGGLYGARKRPDGEKTEEEPAKK